MNPETVNTTYEAITNPILRLMLYMLAAAVVGLCTAVVYLYRDNRAIQREMLDANHDNIRALDSLSDALVNLRSEISKPTPSP